MERILAYFNIGGRHYTDDRETSISIPLLASSSASSLPPGVPFISEVTREIYRADDVLRCMLSTTGCLSIPAFLPLDIEERPKQIGKGQCGTIWALRGRVLKVANKGKEAQLWNDCCKHQRVMEAFQQAPTKLRHRIMIPGWENWIQPSRDFFWNELCDYFPEGFQPTYGILSRRIHALHAPVREALFDYFAPKSMKGNKAKFLACPENKDCLVRLYLGRRAERTSSATFKLRNFELVVNEMEKLGLDTAGFAEVMAHALAVLHGKAGTDADDVEFVLGRAPAVKIPPTAADLEAMGSESPESRGFLALDSRQRSTGTWLLDFNQCQTFPKSAKGTNQLQKAFFFNDPYYPRPISHHPNDVLLWKDFKTAYLEASAHLIVSDLPKQFIDAVEREGARRAAQESIFD